MTSTLARYRKLAASAVLIAGLSQAQGYINGPLPLPLSIAPPKPKFMRQLGDAPNPRGYPYPIDVRTWTQNLLQSTLSLPATVNYAVAPPQPWLGWKPRPNSQLVIQRWSTQSLLETTLGGPIAPPLRPVDAPNPRGPTYAIGLRTWTQSARIGQIPPNPLPPATYDQPNPLGYGYPVSLRTLALSLIQTTLADQSAIPETCAWGNPPSGMMRTNLGWTQGMPRTLLGGHRVSTLTLLGAG